VALEQKDYDTALAELGKGNQQDPAVLYRTCLALEGKGDHAKARESCRTAADFNSLPQINYALVRSKARKMADRKTS
jgi:hypothetical protein